MASDSETQQETEPEVDYTYVKQLNYPSKPPAATIYFNGLLCVCFDHTNGCTVAMNNKASHKVGIQISKGASCDRITFSEKFHTLRIKATNPVPEHKGVYVYAPNSVSSEALALERYSYVDYTLDMEGSEMHNKRLTKVDENLWPRIHMTDGLFSAYKLSKSKFVLNSDKTGEHTKGKSIGLALAADLFLDGGNIEF